MAFVPCRTKRSPSRQYDAITPGIFSMFAAPTFFFATEWSISHDSMAVDW